MCQLDGKTYHVFYETISKGYQELLIGVNFS